MRSLEETRPRPGLLGAGGDGARRHGALIEEDQRALVRFVIQDGFGADIVFAAGTTGEWDRVGNDVRQRVVQICAEEVAKCNAALARTRRPVEAWAGITAQTPQQTLENLDFAIAHGADAAVLAPLSIQGVDDPVRFVARDVADLLDCALATHPGVSLRQRRHRDRPARPPHPHPPGEGALPPRLRARHQGVGADEGARELHPRGGGLPRARRVRHLRRATRC